MANSERTKGLYGLLRLPFFYNKLMSAVGGPKVLADLANTFLPNSADLRILDVGAGTSSILKYLHSQTDYTSLEPNPEYVSRAIETFGDRGRFLDGGIAKMETLNGPYDAIIAIGLLHHIDEELAKEFFRNALNLLTEDGIIFTLDGAFVPKQSRISRFVVSRDRGRHIRSVRQMAVLGLSTKLDVCILTSNSMLRIPYSHVAMILSRGEISTEGFDRWTEFRP